MHFPDFSAVPYQTYSTKWSHRLSVLFVLCTVIIAFVYVFLPWWHERDFSVQSSTIPIDYSNQWDISNEIDEFMNFVNLRFLVASSVEYQVLKVEGAKCNITQTSYDPKENLIHFQGLSKYFFQLDGCMVDCADEFGGYNPFYPDDRNFYVPRNESKGGCILPTQPNIDSGFPFIVANFQFLANCSDPIPQYPLSLLTISMQSAQVCDCEGGYRKRSTYRVLTTSCTTYAGSKMYFGYTRVRVTTYDRWGFVRKREIIYQNENMGIMNTNGWPQNRYQLLLLPSKMEVEIRHTDVFAMLSRMAGMLGLMNVILVFLQIYNRRHMQSEVSSKSERERFIMSGNPDHLQLSPDELELNISIAGGVMCYTPKKTES